MTTPATQHEASQSTDRRGLTVLDMSTCLRRLSETPVGRVAFFDRGEIVILPVNHVLDGVHVAFRTTTGSKLENAANHGAMSFEVDNLDPMNHCGWSVLVVGTAEVVGATEAIRLESLMASSWAASGDSSWVWIRPSEISGREITGPR